MNKPPSIEDLFQPTSPTNRPIPANNTSVIGTMLAWFLLAGVICFTAWQHLPFEGRLIPDGQDQGQVDPSKISGTAVYIYDLQQPTIDMILQFDDAKELATENPDVAVRAVDDTEDETEAVTKLKAFAKSKGIDPPCVVHINGATRKPDKAITWPKNRTELLKVFK